MSTLIKAIHEVIELPEVDVAIIKAFVAGMQARKTMDEAKEPKETEHKSSA